MGAGAVADRGAWQGPRGGLAAEIGKVSSTELRSPSQLASVPSSPGKITRTQLLSPSMPSHGGGAPTHRPPPVRVADAKRDEARLNAVLKVVVTDDGR